MTEPAPDALWRDQDGRPIYRHRPKLVGAEITFTLEERDLTWSDARSSGRIPLHQIDSVRLVFRPANMYMQRYRIEIRQRLGRRIWFSNISYRGLASVEANDAPFAAFIRALLPAIAKASPKARFLAGEPLWRYGATAAVAIGLAGALALVAIEVLRARNWPAAAVVAFVGAYAGWLMWQWLGRNRPAVMDPADPPAALLPPGA